MKLYFLRHGLAADPAEWAGSDYDRPLTAKGRARMTREAEAMASLDVTVDLVLTSPLLRAHETAAIVAAALGLHDGPSVDDRLGLAFNADRLAEIVADHRDAGALMLVGHEPSMSETVGRIIGGANVEFKKGALACVAVDDATGRSGTLLSLIPPRTLVTIVSG